MKGIVFTEFLDMVDAQFGDVIVDQIIAEAALPSGGAYTAVGTYHHDELIRLVASLSRRTDIPVPDLLRKYGEHLFARFAERYARFFVGADSCFGFLERIEGYIHVEVCKLHPDAELPSIGTRRLGDDGLELTYRSSRPFGDFAEGLIHGCIAHFQERIAVERENVRDPTRTCVRFTLTKHP